MPGASSFSRLLKTADLRPWPFQMRFQVSSSEAPGPRGDCGGNRGNLQSTEGSRHFPRCPPHGPGAPVPALPGVFSTAFSRFLTHGSGTRSLRFTSFQHCGVTAGNSAKWSELPNGTNFLPPLSPYKSPRNLTTSLSR